MNRNELIDFASRRTRLSKRDCLNCLNAITELIGEVLRRGESVKICGFGKFEPKIRHERKGINPQTLEELIVRQRVSVGFKSFEKFDKNLK